MSKNHTASDTSNDRHEITRRSFVVGGAVVGGAMVGATAGVVSLGSVEPVAARTQPPIVDYPFTLGIASGDPLANGVVIWTRLAPDPLDGGGMADETYRVEWEVADDPAMAKVVRRGRARAQAEHGHSVHVDVRGLRPDRDYWYRFRVGDHVSPTGRTRTTPRSNARPESLVFGLVSCQRYNAGYYTAYDDLVASAPDLVVHVGDYIYESPGGGVRSDPLPESITLDEYRNRYALYKSDASLMAAHEVAPWLFTWDDHEVENNHAGLVPEIGSATPDPAAFAARRTAAYKAYWEHMPFRARAPRGVDFRIHRHMPWGRLADFFVLDTRQYRADQCGEVGPPCEPVADESREMLGARQQRWLDRGIARSRADWSVLAQQVVFSRMDLFPGAPEFYNLDQWDGYAHAREQVLETMRTRRPNDNIVLTGDIHASGVSNVMTDYRDPGSAPMGAEFVGTSVSSSGNDLLGAVLPAVLAENPHIKWADNAKRGWVKHTVTRDAWRADFRHVDDVRVEGSPVETATSWVVPRGEGAQTA
ncbi:MAG: alkaline phosphatase D family protein [Acidimicrobiales bacterium]